MRAGLTTSPNRCIDPAALLRRALNELGILLTDHVEFGSRSQAVAVALWLAQAAARDSERNPIWLAFPRLLITSQQNGSGKSTLAFDILFAEGQRRFLDSMSAYARQFAEQLEKPELDQLAGLPPTVAIEQRGQATSDPHVTLHPGVLGVLGEEIVALLLGDHLQGQLIVIAEEDGPLRARRGVRNDRMRLARVFVLLHPGIVLLEIGH